MKQVSPQELKNWINSGKHFVLLDVREDYERAVFNIGGEHIPTSELGERMSEIPKDKDVVVYCEKGIRSVLVIQRMENYGFHNLYNLSGGMKAWKSTS
jgi:rhodanese-related sulfurtransferase